MEHHSHAEIYDANEVERYSKDNVDEPIKQAFLIPHVKEYLAAQVPGKKVVDILCGTGDWVKCAAESGAKSVDGFEDHEDMVKLAQQATVSFGNVKICLGDVKNMPYGDNTFDLALSFYVTCGLKKPAFDKHFTEMYRILSPGGKAVVLNLAKSAFDVMYLHDGANRATVESKIESALAKLPVRPSNEQIHKAFADLTDVVLVTFTLNKDGRLYRVNDANQLKDGQAVWIKTQAMVFPDYFYTTSFINDHTKSAGLKIDQIEHYFTEHKRQTHHSNNSMVRFEKAIIDDPPFFLYHLSKPAK